MMFSMQKLFLYARKSTDVEDKQIMSIERQLFELRELAQKEGLSVICEIVEKQSAKTPGRPLFNDMMDRIENGEAEGILAWHPDRLSRNGVDGGRIMYALDIGTLTTLKFPTFWFENTPQGKFMLNMAFSQSKYYVDSLGVNTKSGLDEKVRRGECPTLAPIGYINDYRTKKIIVDRERAPLVKEVFELYASGNATLDSIRTFLAKRGVKSKNGWTLSRNRVSRMLSNPIYYGHFRYRDEVHVGTHDPIIDKELFDRVDAILNQRWRYSPSEKQTVEKPFLGLLKCATCGGAVTAEIQKGHTYYRCTKKNRAVARCNQPYVREEALDLQISDLLKPFALPADWAEGMLELVRKEKKTAAQSASQLVAVKRSEIEKIDQRIQRLLDTFLDQLIDRETFTTEKAKLMSQKKTLEGQKDACTAGRADWLEPLQNWILTAKNAGFIAESGTLQEKRGLAQKVFGSNLVLDCKKARGSCMKPWSLLVATSQSGGMVGWRGLEPRTNALKGHCSTN
jgi:site-specific DNA recombinase